MKTLDLYYDGECIFCKNYAVYHRLHSEFARIQLHNMRELSPEQKDMLMSRKVDINKGVVAIIVEDSKEKVLQGKKVMGFLGKYDANPRFLGRMNRLFQNSFFASLIYPFVYVARWLLLKLRGINPKL